MRTLAVALDLLREASHRRWFLFLIGAVSIALIVLLGGLQLDVVDGTLAGTRLFGHLFNRGTDTVESVMSAVFTAASYVTFYGGILFGVYACADFGPSLLSPGRIEHLLALPVRRWELLLGTFLGVLALALSASLYAAGGLTVILGLKTGHWTVRPLLSALLAGVAFASVYAGMLTTALFVRSAAIGGLVGMGLFFSGVLASYRERLAPMFSDGPTRALFSAYTLFMPRVASLAGASAQLAGLRPTDVGALVQLLIGFAVFALGALGIGLWRFEQKDF